MSSNSVPIKLLHEGEGHVVTVELKNGEIYRGLLKESEDTMNCQLEEVTMTARNGKVKRLANVFVRGGQIKFIVLPDLLKRAPILAKIGNTKSSKNTSGAPPAKRQKT
jgi:small nuclear ribonucleoprotein D3